jgi:acyl CoA:acetate/3-ketoacid CoA transferase alpha subunit
MNAFRRYAANNFSSVMAKNAKLTIVEVSNTKKNFAVSLMGLFILG